MTPNDYVNLVATELDDPGKVTFTQSDIEEALQNAYHYIAVLTGCFPKITSVNFPTSPYWEVDIPDYFSILLAYNPNSKRFIEIRDLSYLEALNDSWDTKFITLTQLRSRTKLLYKSQASSKNFLFTVQFLNF